MLDRSMIEAADDDVSSAIEMVDDDDDGDNMVADVLPMIAVLFTMLFIIAVGVVDIDILL